MKRLNEVQKTAIKNFRTEGMGYKAIADQLSLSRETVRSFCTRNDIPTEKPSDNRQDTLSDGSSEVKAGNTVFVITTGNSPTASETLEKKLEKLILDAVSKTA